jgi:hypothetical protein
MVFVIVVVTAGALTVLVWVVPLRGMARAEEARSRRVLRLVGVSILLVGSGVLWV